MHFFYPKFKLLWLYNPFASMLLGGIELSGFSKMKWLKIAWRFETTVLPKTTVKSLFL